MRLNDKVAVILAAAGIAWFLPEWSDPEIGVSVAFTIGLALAWLYPAIIGHVLFTVAGTAHPAHIDRLVAIGYLSFAFGLGIVPAVGFDPHAAGCGLCPANVIAIGGPQGLFDGLNRVATVVALAWCSSACIVLAYALARSGPMTRQVGAPVLIPGIVFLVLVVVALGRTLVATVPPTDPTDRLLRLGQGIAVIVLAIGVAFEWLLAQRSRSAVARVVADLAEAPPIGGLRDHLATILRDPALQLAYPVGGGVTVDTRGRPVDLRPRPGRTTTPIVREGTVVAVIEHDRDVLRDSGAANEVVAAARLGLEHERLQADARAQLETFAGGETTNRGSRAMAAESNWSGISTMAPNSI